mmetsp:Transcript_51172/g.117678  ORF Transcript_51172/g.117678 Transcript_51172/m.117678 type:complete len:347 (+) Transcript_51172:281-1321(+)
MESGTSATRRATLTKPSTRNACPSYRRRCQTKHAHLLTKRVRPTKRVHALSHGQLRPCRHGGEADGERDEREGHDGEPLEERLDVVVERDADLVLVVERVLVEQRERQHAAHALTRAVDDLTLRARCRVVLRKQQVLSANVQRDGVVACAPWRPPVMQRELQEESGARDGSAAVPARAAANLDANEALPLPEDVAALRLRAPRALRRVRRGRLEAVEVAVHGAEQQIHLAVARQVIGEHLRVGVLPDVDLVRAAGGAVRHVHKAIEGDDDKVRRDGGGRLGRQPQQAAALLEQVDDESGREDLSTRLEREGRPFAAVGAVKHVHSSGDGRHDHLHAPIRTQRAERH